MAEITQARITAAEFAQLPETTQPTELLNREVIVSPAPLLNHQKIVANIYSLLIGLIKNGEVYFAPVDVRLDDENVVQPDLLWIAPDSACKPVEGKYFNGAPDLIVEVISPGTIRADKVTKFNLYEKHGVIEYWLVDPEAQTLEVWIRGEDDKYTRQGVYATDALFASTVLGDNDISLEGIFPG